MCPSCETVYRVDPTKVPAMGIRTRCSVCSNVFTVSANGAPAPPPPASRPPAPAPVAAPMRPAASPPATPIARPAMPAAQPVRRPTLAARPASPVVNPFAARPAAPSAPAAAARAAPAAPVAPRAALPQPPPAPAPAPQVAPPRATVAPSVAAPPAATPPAKRGTGPLRPVNPFMVQDPKQKARRLARALISDMLVYHPEKRQQGIRDGTLPQLFKEEIDKSWQEYVEQVGQEMAQSTPFWSEALNEILAGGKKLF